MISILHGYLNILLKNKPVFHCFSVDRACHVIGRASGSTFRHLVLLSQLCSNILINTKGCLLTRAVYLSIDNGRPPEIRLVNVSIVDEWAVISISPSEVIAEGIMYICVKARHKINVQINII